MARRQVRTDGRTDGRTAYGPGFVASAILLAAVLLCGVLLVAASFGADAPLPQATGFASRPVPATGGTPPVGYDGCGPPADDRVVPRSAPAGAHWVVYRRTVVPQHAAIGPARTDDDGFRHCFAHSPTGAVYAAYNAIGSLSDDAVLGATTRKLLLPGPDRDRLLREPAPDEPSDPVRLYGFRIIDASRDRLTVALAMRIDEAMASGTFTMVWYAGDWRVLPPGPGQEFGAPYAQLRDLSGFVPWGGV
jgi:hypothetical protein